jgi:hypothetical protein
MGDLLNLNLSAIYPKQCYTIKCRQRYVDKVLITISTIYSNFSLPIHFTNGVLFSVKLSFCSFNDSKICQVNVGICEEGTNQRNEPEIGEEYCPYDDSETCLYEDEDEDEDEDDDEDEDEDEEVCSVDCDYEDVY